MKIGIFEEIILNGLLFSTNTNLTRRQAEFTVLQREAMTFAFDDLVEMLRAAYLKGRADLVSEQRSRNPYD